MSDKEIRLLFDNPDGTQKQWIGRTTVAEDLLEIGFGKVGATPQFREIPKANFSSMNTPLNAELNLRADKKRREGYYYDPSVDPMDGLGQSAHASQKPFRRESVMAALDGDGGPDWFF